MNEIKIIGSVLNYLPDYFTMKSKKRLVRYIINAIESQSVF